MATADQVAKLRRLTAEPTTDTYSDLDLNLIIASNDDCVLQSAAEVWREKAGVVASLVNISEDGSSRSQGNLYLQYLEMAKEYEAEAARTSQSSATRTRRIFRV